MYRNAFHLHSEIGGSLCAMGWLRLVRSLKLYVFFVEYRLFQMAVLQKRPLTLLYTEIGGSLCAMGWLRLVRSLKL